MRKEFIKISVTGLSTPKGKRKPIKYLDELTRVNNIETANGLDLISMAKEYISKKHRVESCRIILNKAFEEDEMVFVTLLPFKTIEVIVDIL